MVVSILQKIKKEFKTVMRKEKEQKKGEEENWERKKIVVK